MNIQEEIKKTEQGIEEKNKPSRQMLECCEDPSLIKAVELIKLKERLRTLKECEKIIEREVDKTMPCSSYFNMGDNFTCKDKSCIACTYKKELKQNLLSNHSHQKQVKQLQDGSAPIELKSSLDNADKNIKGDEPRKRNFQGNEK